MNYFEIEIDSVGLTTEQQAQIRDHAARVDPEECCGVLLGRRCGAQVAVVDVVACMNASDSPKSRFEISPRELIDVQRKARNNALEIVGFYHSHPNGPAEPSPTDQAEAFWPDCAWVIVGRDQLRAWRYAQGQYSPVSTTGT